MKKYLIINISAIITAGFLTACASGASGTAKGDAAIAMISVSTLAFGYLIMNVFSSSSNLSGDVCSTLFGSTSILTLTPSQVWLCTILSIAVVLIFVLFYNKIFAVTFDEGFSRATGTNVEFYKLMIAVIVADAVVFVICYFIGTVLGGMHR